MRLMININNVYTKFCHANNNGRGICAGLCFVWVRMGLSAMASKNEFLIYNKMANLLDEKFIFYYAAEFQKTQISLCYDYENTKNIFNRLNGFMGKEGTVITWETCTGALVKSRAEHMIKYPQDCKGTGAMLSFDEPGKNGHLCAILCDGRNTFFLDPNVGIYQLDRDDSFNTLGLYIKSRFSQSMQISDSAANSTFVQLKDKSSIRQLQILGPGYRITNL